MMLLYSFVICMVSNLASAGVLEDLIYEMEKRQSYKPAFFVTLSKTVNLRKNHVVKFDAIKTNIGGGYDASSGVFTVPRKGTYEFAVNFITSNRNEWLELDLIKNNIVVVRGHAAYDKFTSGSLQAILELNKGDRTWVSHPRSSGQLYGYNFTMFSGHFI
ncbi:C1QL [Mytilus coruscus]|uniref:C1QL n=1 Tax=Mytilus coruscus TaxID=42192 RepID=A0A6J8DWE0_MYTCO|nr:C1QL [Mytilus coruscus]